MTSRRRLVQRLLAPVILAVLRLLWLTYRFRISDESEIRRFAAQEQPVIFCLWHGEIVPGSWFIKRLDRLGLRLTFIVSPSKDGEFAMRIIERMGGRAVRGSATRSGVKALKGLYREITRERCSTILLPDGPRGPNRQCKEGPVVLSQLAQAPIVPIAIEARPGVRLRSWDRLVVPLPFARVAVEIGAAFVVPKGLDQEAMETRRADLEQTLLDLGRRAREGLGISAE